MTTEFKMDFNTSYNGRTYEVEDGYLFEIRGMARVGKYKLIDSLISELEKIKEDFDYNNVRRVCETTRVLVTKYAPDFCEKIEE